MQHMIIACVHEDAPERIVCHRRIDLMDVYMVTNSGDRIYIHFRNGIIASIHRISFDQLKNHLSMRCEMEEPGKTIWSIPIVSKGVPVLI